MLRSFHHLSARELSGEQRRRDSQTWDELPGSRNPYITSACYGWDEKFQAGDQVFSASCQRQRPCRRVTFGQSGKSRHHLGGITPNHGPHRGLLVRDELAALPLFVHVFLLPLCLTATGARPHFKRPPTDKRCLVGTHYGQHSQCWQLVRRLIPGQ